jgi:hypothetical protein
MRPLRHIFWPEKKCDRAPGAGEAATFMLACLPLKIKGQMDYGATLLT